MKVAVKQNPIGKPQNNFDARQITFGWNNTDMAPTAVVAHIVSGMPFAVAHFQDGHRKSANFMTSECIALDADGIFDDHLNAIRPFTEAEYLAMLQHPIVTQHAFAVIQSFSSSEGAYKCRILFHLSEAITDAKEYKALVSVLMSLFPYADPAAKDAARAFFGGKPGRLPDFINYGNVLDVGWLRQHLTKQEVQKAAQRKSSYNDPYPEQDSSVEHVREALRHIPPQLNYDEWLAILMAIHAGYPGAEGIALAEEWSPGYPGEIAHKFASFKDNQVTLGTLFFYARQYGYRFPEKTASTKKNKRSSKKQDDILSFCDRIKALPAFTDNPVTALEALAQRYISMLDIQHPTVLIKSPIGTGKTELLKKLVQDKKRVLVIVHRQALARSLSERLSRKAAQDTAQQLGIPCYSDLSDEELAQADRVVICLNSLPKLASNMQLRPFDLVALDEITQQIEHLGGDTFTGLEALNTYKHLKSVIGSAKQLIGMDAGLTQLVVDWVESIRGKVHTIVNTYTVDRGTLTLYHKSERVIKIALDYAKQGKTIAIACGLERSEALRIQFADRVGTENVRVINRKNSLSRDTQDFLSTINDKPLPQVLIYTPSLGSGFDITQPVDAVFGFFEGTWFSAPDVMQMLGRCRNTGETHLSIPLITDGKRLDDWRDIFQRDRAAAHITALEGDFDKNGVFVTTPSQDSLSKLLAMFEAERNRSKNQLVQHVMLLVRESGYTLEFNEQKSYPTRQDMNAAKDQYREQHKEMVLAAEPIDDAELDWYKKNDLLTPEVWAGNDCYHIRRTVGIDARPEQPLTPSMYDDLYESNRREALRVFTDLRLEDRYLRYEDRREAKHETLQAKRKHRLKRAQMLRELLTIVFEVQNVTDLHKTQERFTSTILTERMRIWMQQYFDDIPLYFERRKERSDNPMALLRWMLARLGLKLERERVRDGENLLYHYWLDEKSLTRWIGYSDLRLEALNKYYAETVPLSTTDNMQDNADSGTNPPKQLGFDDPDTNLPPDDA